MNKEILMAVDAVSNEKGVDKEIIFDALEAALASATRKKHGEELDVRVSINRKTGGYDTFRRWKVFADESTELEVPERELRLDDARDIDKDVEPATDMDSLSGFLWHASDAWSRRHEPNVMLVHYADLAADLDAEMRRIAERLTAHLNDLAADDAPPECGELARSHHGSLNQDERRLTEEALKRGELAAVVATASLELGIDMGAVDLVCQVE